MSRNSDKELDNGRYSKVIKYIKDDTEDYSLVKYCESEGILAGAKVHAENYFVECPFHDDYSPSMAIHKDGKKYHCFSCGRKGDYLDFLKEYSALKGKRYSMVSLCENLLKNDIKLRMTLEFSSMFIYKDRGLTLAEAEIPKRLKPKRYDKINYINLVNKINKENLDVNTKVYVASMIQAKMPPNEIYASIFDAKVSDVIDLNNIDNLEDDIESDIE